MINIPYPLFSTAFCASTDNKEININNSNDSTGDDDDDNVGDDGYDYDDDDRFTDEEYKARSGCCAFCSRCGLVTLIVWFLTLFIWFYCLDAEGIADDESGI